jgi:hypothetical protein
VWLNGTELEALRFVGDRDITAASEESCAQITLTQGWNILLAAVAETHGEWGFSARIANATELLITPYKPTVGQPTFVVRGTVTHRADGSPVEGAIVRAIDQDLRSQQILGTRRTNSAGTYEIPYTADQFSRAEKASADLIVQVYNDQEELLAESDDPHIRFNANPTEVVDLQVGEPPEPPTTPSEYEILLTELEPVLNGVALADLNEADLTFLVGETGLNAQHLAFLALSARLAHQIDLQGAALYGLFRQDLPTCLEPLLAKGHRVWRSALEASLDANLIPASLRDDLDAIVNRLQNLANPATGETPPTETPTVRRFVRLNPAQLRHTILDTLKGEDPSKTYLNQSLNDGFRRLLSTILAEKGHGALAAFAQTMPDVDLATHAETPLRTVMASQVEAMRESNPSLARLLQETVQTLSPTTTLGQLLGVDQPVDAHPLFDAESRYLKFRGLLGTSTLAAHQLQDAFIERYNDHEGPIEDFWQSLRRDRNFWSTFIRVENIPEAERDAAIDKAVADVQFTCQLSHLTRRNNTLIAALRQQHPELSSLQALTALDLSAWKTLITPADLPDSVPGADDQEKIHNYAHSIQASLEQFFPTDFIAKGFRAPLPEVNLQGVRQVLNQYPALNLRQPLPADLDWSEINNPDATQTALVALRKEINTFPDWDYQTQLLGSEGNGSPPLRNPIREGVQRFFAQASDFTFETTRVKAYLAEHPNSLNGIPVADQPAVTAQLRRMQRVFQIAPRFEQMEALLGEGFGSAASIASVPQWTFIHTLASKVGGAAVAKVLHAQATKITATTQTAFTTLYQGVHDVMPYAIGGGLPNTRKALSMPERERSRLVEPSPSDVISVEPSPTVLIPVEPIHTVVTPVGDRTQAQEIRTLPTWANLFGALEMCACNQCQSVYGPAAYFVDLLEFLPDDHRQKLLRRRPDLAHIQLTCDNAMTPLPYVDLVNEILEYYVAYGFLLPSAAHNTENLTAEELRANPQHTINGAYRKLKNSIYPLSLPFNREVEVARVYLEHLGSSRYEVMKLFQETADAALQRATDGESLKISAEEYGVLTGAKFDGSEDRKTVNELYGYRVQWLPTLAKYPFPRLEFGSTTPEVRALQQLLNRLVNLTPKLGVDGNFGSRCLFQ